MRLLLDSHILIWWLAGDPRLGAHRREAIGASAAEVFFSAVSVWELAVKQAAGRLDLGDGNLVDVLESQGFVELPLAARHAQLAVALPAIHRDPVDRFLVAQAGAEGLTLVTDDAMIRQYPGSVL